MLSGHTHGGQIHNPPVRFADSGAQDEALRGGAYAVADSHLYVNKRGRVRFENQFNRPRKSRSSTSYRQRRPCRRSGLFEPDASCPGRDTDERIVNWSMRGGIPAFVFFSLKGGA